MGIFLKKLELLFARLPLAQKWIFHSSRSVGMIRRDTDGAFFLHIGRFHELSYLFFGRRLGIWLVLGAQLIGMQAIPFGFRESHETDGERHGQESHIQPPEIPPPNMVSHGSSNDWTYLSNH